MTSSQHEKDIQGVLVQEIPNVKAIQKMQGDADIELASGVMRVLLVTLDVSDPFGDSHRSDKGKASDVQSTDIWVVLEIGSNFSFPVRANQTIIPERSTSSYSFPSIDVPGAGISLVLSSVRQSASIEQFEELLTDYCAFHGDVKDKGTIELMDEKGQLLGTIDGPWQLEEDAGMHQPGYEKDPVLVELPTDDMDSGTSSSNEKKITVSAAPRTQDGDIPSAYQNDWLFRGATFVSKSLITGSTWAGQKMTSAADSYVSKTTPPASRQSPTPGDNEKDTSQFTSADASRPLTTSGRPAVTFHPKVHAASQQVKAFSGTATVVSGRTRDAVLSVAGKVGDKIGKTTGIQAQPSADGTIKQSGIRGVLNRSLIAANVVLDGITQSADTLLASSGEASSRAIEHRYGSEAKVISGNTASLGRSAFVVYKDINGVRRKALLKIATGTIKARAPDGSEVILQQENIHSYSAQAPSTVTAPPAYGQDSKSDYRSKSDNLTLAESTIASLESLDELTSRVTRSLPFDYWTLYDTAPILSTPRHHRQSEYWHSPTQSIEHYCSSPPFTERNGYNNSSKKSRISTEPSGFSFASAAATAAAATAPEHSTHFQASLFPSSPSSLLQVQGEQEDEKAAFTFVSFSPHFPSAAEDNDHHNNKGVKSSSSPTTTTPSSYNSAFTFSMLQCCGGSRIQHPLRRMKLRTPSQLRITVTPRRIMGKSALDSGGNHYDGEVGSAQMAEVVDTAKWTASTYNNDENATECDECASPLLKASQGSSGRTLDRMCCLTDSDGASDEDIDIKLQDGDDASNTLSLLRQMRRHDVDDCSPDNSSSDSKRPRIQRDSRQGDDDPFDSCSASPPLSPAKCAAGEQVDAASILLSIGQGIKLHRESRYSDDYNMPTLKRSLIEDEIQSEDENEEDEEVDDCHQCEKDSSPCQGHQQRQPYSGDMRQLPEGISLDLAEFPRLYQRYNVPSFITQSKRTAIFGTDQAEDIEDEELRLIAKRGMKVFGSWNEPVDALDLYTPRWVRGTLKDKLGLCTICYEENPGQRVWKRTKTSEYNYHLINQHGISPQTHRPYDPPIAFRIKKQTSTSAGHRKTIIQGKCHACKSYIDMQGKYTGKVKVPEIYWWKHARKCHKGKRALADTSAVFVEDKFYHCVKASMD